MSIAKADTKDQSTEARRAQILLGAGQVFAQKGFHKATTKEIARTAGVAEGTIYNYFANKRELLLAMVEMVAAQSLKNVVQDHRMDDPKTFLSMILYDRLELLQEQGQLLAPLVAEIFADADLRQAVYNKILMPITVLVEQYLQQLIDAGKLRPINPIIITRAVIGTLIINAGIKFANLDSRYENISTDDLVEEIVSLLFNGLLIPDN